MDFKEYIKPELLVLIPVIYIIGLILKKSKCADKWIPFVLGVVAIVLSTMWVFSTSDIIGFKDVIHLLFVSFTQGILVTGASVYFNQLYIQAKKDE